MFFLSNDLYAVENVQYTAQTYTHERCGNKYKTHFANMLALVIWHCQASSTADWRFGMIQHIGEIWLESSLLNTETFFIETKQNKSIMLKTNIWGRQILFWPYSDAINILWCTLFSGNLVLRPLFPFNVIGALPLEGFSPKSKMLPCKNLKLATTLKTAWQTEGHQYNYAIISYYFIPIFWTETYRLIF